MTAIDPTAIMEWGSPCANCEEGARAALSAALPHLRDAIAADVLREAEHSEEHRLEDLGQNNQGRGWYWRCRCGWLEHGLSSVEGAAREWRRHILEQTSDGGP